MLKQEWPALRSCKQKLCKGKSSGGRGDDCVSKLPDDILLSILSPLTLKEAARTSVLSQRWKDLWLSFPNLNFEDPIAKERMDESKEVVGEERSVFTSWVNNIVNKHTGYVIHEFRVIFDLDKTSRSDIDKWVDFAFEKHVKKLELNFEQTWLQYPSWHKHYNFPVPSNLSLSTKPNLFSLTSLCLNQVNVSTKAIQSILHSSPSLEILRLEGAHYLTNITLPERHSSLQLKHLELIDCQCLKLVDVSTPKLLSFRYFGVPIELHIQNASRLCEVFVGGRPDVPIGPSLASLFKYFSQLEHLSLRMSVDDELNSGIDQVPALPKLKYLKLKIRGKCYHSILGWTSLIEASPVLHKLTLEFFYFDFLSRAKIAKRDGNPLRSLKILELFGFVGGKIDLELAFYVLDKAVGVEEVIVGFKEGQEDKIGARRRTKELKKKMPRGAKLILLEQEL